MKYLKYLWAVLAVLAELFVYGMLASAFGWRSGGGAIVILLLFAAVVATWRAITKKRVAKNIT